ncbi:uncharacterized protein LOC133289776 [Gastrolobium bilobum]|uniref:uncharacterized protein LOC133289776 n=1 Tax=Gastrolobium bilobum TaxID=150636 RepID=UPI002AAF5D46|nr:uncharacterized protein LOC133289776 [Gastrolobium bilobum]
MEAMKGNIDEESAGSRKSVKRSKDGEEYSSVGANRGATLGFPKEDLPNGKAKSWVQIIGAENGVSGEEICVPLDPIEGEVTDWGFQMVVEEDGCYNIKCTKEAKARMRKPWQNALIVKLLGKKVGVSFMKKKLESFWAKSGSITVADLGNEFYSVKFANVEDLTLAITGGPWIIFGHYLAVRKWEPCFDPDHANIHKVAAWIRLIPLEFFEFQYLNFFGNLLGTVLKVDRTTSTGDKGRFARVCLDLDLSKPLIGEYKLEGKMKKIEYEGLYLICLHCGRYGHNIEGCTELVKNQNPVDIMLQWINLQNNLMTSLLITEWALG